MWSRYEGIGAICLDAFSAPSVQLWLAYSHTNVHRQNHSADVSVKLKLVSISQSKSKVKEIIILTLIKNSFKRYVREQLVDFPQDIRFAGKRCIAIPDLYNIFPVSNANTDANNLIVWKINRQQTVNKYSSMQLICWDSSFIVEECTHS